MESDNLEMSIVEHLEELRNRLIKSIIAVVIAAFGAYFFSEELMEILTRPVGELVFLRPTEAFFTYIKISIFAGIIVALPFLLYQFWSFVLPALHDNEKKIYQSSFTNFIIYVCSWYSFWFCSCFTFRNEVFIELW